MRRAMTAAVEPVANAWSDDITVRASSFGHLLSVDVKVHAPNDVAVQAILYRPNWHREGMTSREDGAAFFRFLVPAIALRPAFDVTVMVNVGASEWVDAAVVRGTHDLTFEAAARERSPLLLSGVARGGTTMSMRMLAEHPEIACVTEYPYESRHAQYLVRHMIVGVSPSDRQRSMRPQEVNSPSVTSGSNPFFSPGMENSEWLSTSYQEFAATHVKELIGGFYDEVASAHGKPQSRFFAEKFPGVEQGTALRNLFPGTREVFLIRDLRDVVCSATSMNERRGGEAFGAAVASSPTEHLRNLTKGTMGRWQKYRADWPESDVVLLRYEDLVLAPHATIGRACRALGLDSSDATVGAMVAGALGDTGLQDRHVTSSDVASSVGRWRTDLDPEAAAAAPEILAEFDESFGYPLERR